MNKDFEAFQAKFRVTELLIKSYRHWNWSVRPVQGTLGAGIISLSRPAEAWSEATAEETAELNTVIRDIESRCRASFQYEKINYLMLMMVDNHVHFHVFPRYSATRQFAGIEWQDSNWPKPPELASGITDTDKLLSVRDKLKS